MLKGLTMRIFISMLTVLFVAATLSVAQAADSATDLLADEKKLVTERLTEKPDTVILAVDGMCCRTCALGIGKKACQLEFVDTAALPPTGVHIDRANSLLTVAVKKGEVVNVASLAEAIRKAGYNPVRFYQLVEGKKLTIETIAATEKK
jgi:copper chaperone CopZ